MSFVDVIITASEDLNILIQSRNGFVDSIEFTASQAANTRPSPVGRLITSTTREENDGLSIEGWVREFNCNGTRIDTLDYAARFKRTISAQKFTSAAFATIYTPLGVFRNMRIADFKVSIDGNKHQELYFSSTWQAVNLAGGVLAPDYVNGGLVL